MRKTWLSLMLLTFIFLVPLAGCGFLSGSQERFGTDELSVYGLKLGDDKQKLLNTLGVPKAKDIHHWEKIDPILYLYDKLSFFLLDDKIAGIASEDKEFATKRGVGIGDAFAKLVDAYASDGLRGVFGDDGRIEYAYVNGRWHTLIFAFAHVSRDQPPVVDGIMYLRHELLDRDKGIEIVRNETGVALLTAEDWKRKREERDTVPNVRVRATAEAGSADAAPKAGTPAKAGAPAKASTPAVEDIDVAADASALIDAAEAGNLAEVRRLLEAGADPNEQDGAGRLALHQAALFGHRDIVRLLLKSGADPNARTFEGSIPLSSAIFSHLIPNKPPSAVRDIVADLLKAGADPNAKDEFLSEGTYTYALTLAIVDDLTEVVRLLLEAGADPDAPDSEGHTALDYAKTADDPEILYWVQQYSKNRTIHEQLYYAVSDNQPEKVRELLKAGADPDLSTALLTAVSQRNIEMIKLLLDAGANPDPEPFHGSTPLSIAGWNNDLELAALLLQAGALPNRTVHPEIWVAVENGNADMVHLLLDHGADPNALWLGDETLLETAKKAGLTEIVEMLEAAGAQ